VTEREAYLATLYSGEVVFITADGISVVRDVERVDDDVMRPLRFNGARPPEGAYQWRYYSWDGEEIDANGRRVYRERMGGPTRPQRMAIEAASGKAS
jgi:hypothetical protein